MPDTWELPYNKGLPKRLKERGGCVAISMPAGNRLLSHAFLDPPRYFFKNGINPRASVIAQVTVTESEGTEWDPNPRNEIVNPSIPAQWGIVLCRNSPRWDYEVNSRIFVKERTEIAPGTVRVEIPLDPGLWRGVFEPDMATKKAVWRDIWKDECRLGICFGGQFYAHGISVKVGSGVITIDELRLIPK